LHGGGDEGSLLQRLEEYDWPGNVRELRNTIERATILAGAGTIGVEHLPPQFGEAGFAPLRGSRGYEGYSPGSYGVDACGRAACWRSGRCSVEVGTTVDEAERQLILKTLQSTQNNKTKAAEILGISSKTLQNKLKE
jgi:DNA-binding NtrC family response regulator